MTSSRTPQLQSQASAWAYSHKRRTKNKEISLSSGLSTSVSAADQASSVADAPRCHTQNCSHHKTTAVLRLWTALLSPLLLIAPLLPLLLLLPAVSSSVDLLHPTFSLSGSDALVSIALGRSQSPTAVSAAAHRGKHPAEPGKASGGTVAAIACCVANHLQPAVGEAT